MRWPVLDCTVDYQGFYRSTGHWPPAVTTVATGIMIGIDRFVITEQSKELNDCSRVE